MKTFIDMKTAGDILAKDITARKQKMEHPFVEIIPLEATDVVIASYTIPDLDPLDHQ